MSEHRQCLGFKPRYEIIDQCSVDCREVERKWIEHYKNLGFKLRNIYYGQGPHFLPEASIEKLRELGKRPVTWGAKIAATLKGNCPNWSEEGLKIQEQSRFKQGRKKTVEEIERDRKNSIRYWRDRTEEEMQNWAAQSTKNNKEMWARRTKEQRSAIAYKAWETKRRKALLTA